MQELELETIQIEEELTEEVEVKAQKFSAVQELFKDETKWVKGALAQNSEGVDVSPTSYAAGSFCLIGSVRHCYPGKDKEKFRNTALQK